MTATDPSGASISITHTATFLPPPATPAFTVQSSTCGGQVTASLTGTADPNITYSWQWGDGGSSAGPGPQSYQYGSSGTFTITVTATDSLHCSQSATSQVTIANACCPSGVSPRNVLGQAGRTTILTGGATYSGSYWVQGNLLLTNGTYTLTSGTVFYVDGKATRTPDPNGGYDLREVTGATITVGDGAQLLADGATLTVAGTSVSCPMWGGLVLTGTRPAGSPTPLELTGCTISHALYGLQVDGNCNTTDTAPYSLRNCTFLHNLYHVLDGGLRQNYRGVANQAALIDNCTFDSDPKLMHYPYNTTTATDRFFTHKAVDLPIKEVDEFLYKPDVVRVMNNHISHALYGIVSNQDRTNRARIQNNVLDDIYEWGIWAVNNYAAPQAPDRVPVVSGNRVQLSGFGGQVTEQLPAIQTSALIGVGGENTSTAPGYQNLIRQNTVLGDPASSKIQRGIGFNYQSEMRGNYVQDLNEGIWTQAAAADLTIADNQVVDCPVGVSVWSTAYVPHLGQIGCNSLQGQNATVALTGIYITPNTDFTDQGTQSNPAGNSFHNLNQTVFNDGNNAITYWRTSSPLENVPSQILGTGKGQAVMSPVSPTSYCSGVQGATNGNGINQRSAGGLTSTYYAALADTVRRQLVPRPRRRAYLMQVLGYYLGQGQAAGLEAWWTTLLPQNAEDYRSTGLALLGAYDAPGAAAGAAGRVLAGLQGQAQLDAGLAAELSMRQVRQHLRQSLPQLLPADSVALRTLAWSGTGVAEGAARWLRFFYSGYPLPSFAPTQVALRPAATRPGLTAGAGHVGLAAAPELLGEVHPNPAQGEALVSCRLPAGAEAGALCLTSLLTGRPVLTVPVPAGEAAGEAGTAVRVPLGGLAAGPYAVRLLVGGQPVGGVRQLVVLP